ncbi:hypothetical protein [Streptomyces noursei]|uniref:hypothetical protein n=1 Tax=Streptomyces noursei TaxID=1971 RepID=UPI0011AF43DA|nr:hypothetical protein [Streptomyces noursei]
MSGKSRKSRQRSHHRSTRSLMAEALDNAGGELPLGILARDLNTLIRRGWVIPTPDGKSWRISKAGRDAHSKGIN